MTGFCDDPKKHPTDPELCGNCGEIRREHNLEAIPQYVLNNVDYDQMVTEIADQLEIPRIEAYHELKRRMNRA